MGPRCEEVVAVSAQHPVGATARLDDVVTRPAPDQVRARRADEHVVARRPLHGSRDGRWPAVPSATTATAATSTARTATAAGRAGDRTVIPSLPAPAPRAATGSTGTGRAATGPARAGPARSQTPARSHPDHGRDAGLALRRHEEVRVVLPHRVPVEPAGDPGGGGRRTAVHDPPPVGARRVEVGPAWRARAARRATTGGAPSSSATACDRARRAGPPGWRTRRSRT